MRHGIHCACNENSTNNLGGGGGSCFLLNFGRGVDLVLMQIVLSIDKLLSDVSLIIVTCRFQKDMIEGHVKLNPPQATRYQTTLISAF